jgi:ATP adenylyltransferase/5',5'''-P-1,P-4-tetraphosphate phosphorylase II
LAVNALGFAGALLVKDEVQLQQLHVLGGMPLLKQVAG